MAYDCATTALQQVAMIEVERLLALLSPHGFQLAWEQWLGRQFNFDFVRPSPVDGVFEHVDIDSMGKRVEAVYCRVFLSPLRGHRIHFKPSPEVDELIMELGDSVPNRGYKVIESQSQAIDWEQRVAQVAPQRVRALAQKYAQQLALETASAQQAAAEYTRRVREITDEPIMEYLTYQLSRRLNPDQVQQAKRFSAGGVGADVQEASQAAAIAVMLFGTEVDPEHGGFVDDETRKSSELKLRLNIAADMLRRSVP